MHQIWKGFNLALVLLLGLFASPLQAEEVAGLRAGVLVLPLQAGKDTPTERIYVGSAVQNVLEDVLALHSDLEETWAHVHYDKLFPSEEDLKAYVQGGAAAPPAILEVGLRYLITGRINVRNKDITAELEFIDRVTRTKLRKTLPVDLPGLQRLRKDFLKLLHQAGIPVPSHQKSKMLWKESLAEGTFAQLGRGLFDYHSMMSYHKENPVYNLTLYENALRQPARSYLLVKTLGRVLSAQKNFPEAQKWLRQALVLNRFGVDAADGMMRIAHQIGNQQLEETWLISKLKC